MPIIAPPVELSHFAGADELAPLIRADFFSKASREKKGPVLFLTFSKSPSLSIKYSAAKKGTFRAREEFLRESAFGEIELIPDEASLSEHFRKFLERALSELSIEALSIDSEKTPVAPIVSEYFLKSPYSKEISETMLFCKNCSAFPDNSPGPELRKFLLFPVSGGILIGAEFEKAEEIFSASGVSVGEGDVLSEIEIPGKGLAFFQREVSLNLSSGKPTGTEILASGLIGASAKNPVTEEFLPILPGNSPGAKILSPGTRKRDLSFLASLPKKTIEKYGLSREKLESIQVKFPKLDGILTEACGDFFGLPIVSGRERILLFAKDKIVSDVFPSGTCECGEPLSLRELKLSALTAKGTMEVGRAFPEKHLFTFSPKESSLLSKRLLPLFIGRQTLPRTPSSLSYILGIERNFNLALKDSGFEKGSLLLEKEEIGKAIGSLTYFRRDFSDGLEQFLSLVLGAMREPRIVPESGKISLQMPLSSILSSNLSDALRLTILSGRRGDISEGELLKMNSLLRKSISLAIRITALSEERKNSLPERLLPGLYSERREGFFSSAERFNNPEAVSNFFLFLSDFRLFLRLSGGGSKGIAREVFLRFSEEIVRPIAPKTAEKISRILGDSLVFSAPSGGSTPLSPKKAILSKKLLSETISSCKKLILFGKNRLEKISIYIAEGWKYRLFRLLLESGGKLPEEPFPGSGNKEEYSEFLRNSLLSKKGFHIERDFLTPEEELSILSAGIPIISETGAKTVQILINHEIPDRKKRISARPGKPAIILN